MGMEYGIEIKMKKCECGACKWKGSLPIGVWQCLKCYASYTTAEVRNLEDISRSHEERVEAASKKILKKYAKTFKRLAE